MPLYGIDISNNNSHQSVVDLAQVRMEGFAFVFAKVSEGDYYTDPFWPGYRDQARAANLFLAGYHYVRGDADPAAQAKVCVDHLGDVSIPVMLDVEANSGGIDVFWAAKDAIEALGAKVALSYIPRWYWGNIAQPDLTGVPGLVASSYTPGSGTAVGLYQNVPSSFWAPYGGVRPVILQFTDKALVDGHLVDANFYSDSLSDFASLLGVAVLAPAPHEFRTPLQGPAPGAPEPAWPPHGPVRLGDGASPPGDGASPPGLGHQEPAPAA